MIVKVYKSEPNTGTLSHTREIIEIRPIRWIDKHKISHPMKFEKPIAFDNKNVYFLYLFGDDSNKPKGVHISLSFFENQKFTWMQKTHWRQKEENIRYIINILFLLGGISIGILNYLK